MKHRLLPLLLLAACAGTPPETSEDSSAVKSTPDGQFDPPGNTVTNVTISGRVFYNDWRNYGRFGLRKDPNGLPGMHHFMGSGSFDAATQAKLAPEPVTTNYLGLRDAKVTVFEVDGVWGVEPDCVNTALIATTSVDADGSWSMTLPSIFDGCGTDGEVVNRVSLAVKVSLEYCDDVRCFSVVDPATGSTMEAMSPWSKWYAGATIGLPTSAGNNANVVLPDLYFEDTSDPDDDTDIPSEAAIAFAGLVDVTRKFHVQGDWPGHVADYGEVYLQFPSPVTTGVTSGTSSIKMKQSQNKFGWTAMHEYGHILDNRITSFSQFGPSGASALTPCGIDYSQSPSSSGYILDTSTECNSWGRTGEKEFKSKSYGEGFADFVVHVTLEGIGASESAAIYLVGCDQAGYDDNDLDTGAVSSSLEDGFARRRIFGCAPGVGCSDAAAYPTNVARALCDWYDTRNDDDGQRQGLGDTLSHSLLAIHDNIENTYEALGEAYIKANGITICDIVAQHLASGANDRATHLDLISNNGFDCDL